MSETVSECPNCNYINQSEYRLCPQCRFPLMLVAGKYQLECNLAEGGMGLVYMASHVHLDFDRRRVIKVIKPDALRDPSVKKRFRREVQVTAALSQKNDHIVRIYDDFGLEKSLGYY